MLQHVLFHAVPGLWRLHRMHHADLEFDASTGLRFHPVEIVMSMGIKLAVVAALIFEVLLNGTTTSALKMNPETGHPRYLEIQIPSPATHKSVGLAILEATGMSGVSSTAKAWEIWGAVRKRLGQMGIKVLWLDEAQDLVMAQSANETETTLRTIKTLMQGDNAVIPILSGTRRLGEMTSFDPQVSRRFTKIAPSDLDHSTDQDDIFGMIDGYCDEAGITARLPDDLAVRLMTGRAPGGPSSRVRDTCEPIFATFQHRRQLALCLASRA